MFQSPYGFDQKKDRSTHSHTKSLIDRSSIMWVKHLSAQFSEASVHE